MSIEKSSDLRYQFGVGKEAIALPNLISLQKNSYNHFLQMDIPHTERTKIGLHGIFSDVFPVKDLSGKAQLEYQRYYFDPPKFNEDECRYKSITYSASLKLVLRLVVWEFDQDSGSKTIRDIKEQDVYMGEIPLMTERGTFIINGVERVIVSQMHRSPGVFFDHDSGRSHISGKYLYAARVVPYRGSWLDFEFDYKDLIHVRIDRRKKISLSTFLFCMPLQKSEAIESASGSQTYSHNGYTAVEILMKFYDTLIFERSGDKWVTHFAPNLMRGFVPSADIIDFDSGEVIAEAGKKITPRMIATLKKTALKRVLVGADFLLEKYLTYDVINAQTGEILIETGTQITEEIMALFEKEKINHFTIFNIDSLYIGPYLINTLFADKVSNREEALIDLVRILRPGEPPTLESGELLYRQLYSDSERYDLSAVGRVKINTRLNLDVSDDVRTLSNEDIFCIIKKLIEIKDGLDEVDDIDNLGNRRVRTVGELIENQYRLGVLRLEKSIKERIPALDIGSQMPHNLLNTKPLISSIREFFGSSPLSQFMDQTNPLSEVAHKRRLSALGPGGLSRDRAVFEVRDVHPTHYGRICPIETPEGPNIGLINALASFAQVNKYGFIETPYRRVLDGHVTDEVVYLTSTQEAQCVVAHSDVEIDAQNTIKDPFVVCSKNGEYATFPREEVAFIDVSPKQLVSVAASLIPFLENNDANRALMGSNMQRQAVPLIKPEAPFVGTGMEQVVAHDSGALILARRSGYVEQVDAKRIVIRAMESATKGPQNVVGVDIYTLRKFERSNMGTCVNQVPLVSVGDFVEENHILADGPSTENGELALGKNVLVAFMSWYGYNFEDSIVISERISRDDVFTSIHIDEFEVVVRDTKLGCEEVTRDIPNVGDEFLRHLDESGIIYVGANINAGDILIGKVTPKGEIVLSPEEKLLRAIFGEKASDVRDTSLRVPPGIQGTVVGVRVFTRRGVGKDARTLLIEQQMIDKAQDHCEEGIRIFENSYHKSLLEILEGKEIISGPSLPKGCTLDEKVLAHVPWQKWRDIKLKDASVQAKVDFLVQHFDEAVQKIKADFQDKIDKISQGDDLSPGILKIVKVFIAVKRKLQAGDKMAGRHGNKGVVSKIVALEDMPFMADGTPIDLIVNPLGVPSRMNVGQILETHLGAAARGIGEKIQAALEQFRKNKGGLDVLKDIMSKLYHKDMLDVASAKDVQIVEMAQPLAKGVKFSCPVFSGAKEKEINELLALAGFDSSGQVTLCDGKTGLPFDRRVTVGYMYMLKLHHLVDDKMHARSIGPYSLVTQQPLGGKAQQGGQRFGEMEFWALEAYGAAFTLQELLTVKSDDVEGRGRAYDAIIRGDDDIRGGEPESFKVLERELRGLCCEIIKITKEEVARPAKKGSIAYAVTEV